MTTQPGQSSGWRIVAEVRNGPYAVIVVGDSYEQILGLAEDYVFERTGQRWTPSYYTDLSSRFPGIVTAEEIE